MKNMLLRMLLAFMAANLIVFIDEEWPWTQHYGNPYALMALAFSWLVALAIIAAVIHVDRSLEKRLPWSDRPNHRMGLQVFFGLVLPAILLPALAALYFHLGPHGTFPGRYFRLEYPINLTLLAAYNGYFLVAHPGLRQLLPRHVIDPAGAQRPDAVTALLEVYYGTEKWLTDPGHIDYIIHQDKYYSVFLDNGDVVLTDHTLASLDKLLDKTRFFRINRSCIVYRDAIKEVKRLGERRLLVVPHRPADVQLIVSQRQVPGFRKWIGKN